MNLRVHSGQTGTFELRVCSGMLDGMYVGGGRLCQQQLPDLHGFTQHIYFLLTKHVSHELAGVSAHHSCLGT